MDCVFTVNGAYVLKVSSQLRCPFDWLTTLWRLSDEMGRFIVTLR